MTDITTSNIRNVYPQLQAGDVVAITTAVLGLDVAHTSLLEGRSTGVESRPTGR